jgi:hypothetical protein
MFPKDIIKKRCRRDVRRNDFWNGWIQFNMRRNALRLLTPYNNEYARLLAVAFGEQFTLIVWAF